MTRAINGRFALTAVSVISAVILEAGCSQIVGRDHVTGTVLTFTALAGEPSSLNPLLAGDANVSDLSHLFLPYLVEIDDRGLFIPEVAMQVPSLANGGISRNCLSVVYHLRHGLKWQDGALITARDVIFTYQAAMNPKNNVAVREGYDHIKSVEAPDSYTAVVRLARPYSAIVAYFGEPILPAHLLARDTDINHDQFNTSPVGSGPYRVVEWQHGDHITFAANPQYWRGKPQIDTFVLKIIPEANTQAEQLQTHEVDADFFFDAQLLPQSGRFLGFVYRRPP